jgi:hypothetical protein
LPGSCEHAVNIRMPKMLRIYLLLELLLAPEGGLCTMEIVYYLAVKFRHDPSLDLFWPVILYASNMAMWSKFQG